VNLAVKYNLWGYGDGNWYQCNTAHLREDVATDVGACTYDGATKTWTKVGHPCNDNDCVFFNVVGTGADGNESFIEYFPFFVTNSDTDTFQLKDVLGSIVDAGNDSVGTWNLLIDRPLATDSYFDKIILSNGIAPVMDMRLVKDSYHNLRGRGLSSNPTSRSQFQWRITETPGNENSFVNIPDIAAKQFGYHEFVSGKAYRLACTLRDEAGNEKTILSNIIDLT